MVDTPVIRPATEADLPAITAIYNDAIRNTTATFDTEEKTLDDRRRWLLQRDARHPVLVAELQGRVAGFAALNPWSDRCAYAATAENSVYVDAALRGGGIGTRLLAALLQTARAAGLHTLIARIAAGNPASEALHRAAGFAHIGTMREVGLKFGRRLDVHMYQVVLGQARLPA